MKRQIVIAIPLLLTACAGRPAPGSLLALQQDVQQDAIETCLKDTIRLYPHVPTAQVWDACHSAVTGRPTLAQRANYF